MRDRKLTFRLICGDDELNLDGKDYSVLDYEGLESTDYQINSDINIIGHGVTIRRTSVLAREIMLKFDFTGAGDILEARDYLIWFFRPETAGTLYVDYSGTVRCIDYTVSTGIKFANKNVHEDLTATVYLTCADPEFRTTEDTVFDLSSRSGGWKWKFRLPFHMRQSVEQKRNVYNDGHLACPVEIYFHGPAESPKVTNERTGEFVQLGRNLASSETLYINTRHRHKEVSIITADGTADAFGYITEASTFFQLEPGDNMISYTAGSLTSTGAQIRYRPLFYGI